MAGQLEFDCGAYTDGTSGGPFLADVDPATGQGAVIGVIGGYEQGGDTPEVSYSSVFGANVAALYADAVAGVYPGAQRPADVSWPRGGQREAGGGTIRSISASSSSDGIHSEAAAFAFTCSGVIAPAITDEQPGWAARPPMATSSTVSPCSSAQAISASTLASFSSVT